MNHGPLREAQHSYGVSPEAEEEHAQFIARMAWRRRLQEAAHLGMRIRLKTGKVIEPSHILESCPICRQEGDRDREVTRSNVRFDADALLCKGGSARLTRIR